MLSVLRNGIICGPIHVTVWTITLFLYGVENKMSYPLLMTDGGLTQNARQQKALESF